MDSEQAFKQAFQTDTATIEKELRAYTGKSSYPGMIYTLTAVAGDKDVQVRPLSDAEKTQGFSIHSL